MCIREGLLYLDVRGASPKRMPRCDSPSKSNISFNNKLNSNKMETNYKNLKNHELPELERKGIFRRWYYMPTQMPVGKKEYYFIADDIDDLKDILEKHRFNDLKGLHCKELSPVELVVLSTKDRQFVAAQIYRYSEDYNFHPKSDISVYKGADAAAFLGILKELKPEG